MAQIIRQEIIINDNSLINLVLDDVLKSTSENHIRDKNVYYASNGVIR